MKLNERQSSPVKSSHVRTARTCSAVRPFKSGMSDKTYLDDDGTNPSVGSAKSVDLRTGSMWQTAKRTGCATLDDGSQD